jgi:hypothetical protein
MAEHAAVPTDEAARDRYRKLLLSVGFCQEVVDGVTEDVFGAIEEAQQEVKE